MGKGEATAIRPAWCTASGCDVSAPGLANRSSVPIGGGCSHCELVRSDALRAAMFARGRDAQKAITLQHPSNQRTIHSNQRSVGRGQDQRSEATPEVRA